MHGTQCDKGCPKQGGRLSPHFGKECSPNCMKFLVPPWQQPEDHSRSLGEGRALQTTLYLPRTCREQWCWAVGLDFAYKHKWDTPFIGTPRNTTGCGHASLGEALSWQSLPINVDGPLWQIIVNSGPNQQSKALLPTMLFQTWGDLRQCSGQCDQNRTLVVVLKKKKKFFFFLWYKHCLFSCLLPGGMWTWFLKQQQQQQPSLSLCSRWFLHFLFCEENSPMCLNGCIEFSVTCTANWYMATGW